MKERVCIIGGGASGMAAAWSLSRYPERYKVDVWEKADRLGGVATSEQVGDGLYINDGVQGGSSSYRNTILLLKELGHTVSPVHMKISFGKGSTFWNNYGEEYETELIRRLRPEIKRFGLVLKIMNYFEFLFIFMPIWLVLKIFWFSSEFGNKMVFPLTALFFGTGNQTPYVSAAIVARVFLDPDLRLFDYDPDRLLSQSPEMFSFPNLGDVYQSMKDNCEKRGASIFLNRPVSKIVRTMVNNVVQVRVLDQEGNSQDYDRIIFACDAETVLKVLETPSRMERFTLGNVKYYNDVTITHEDTAYMTSHYEMDLEKRTDQYFIRIDPDDPSKLDMSFNLSFYQPQLQHQHRQIYQTIFLDDTRSSTWTIDEISEEKILFRKWWRQFAHSWKHFSFVVPFIRFIQGSFNNSTFYCGSYTLINTHEIAIISGLAAAKRLGANYPFPHDKLAHDQFTTYVNFIHGSG